jgi:hypothetical protein
VRVRGWRKNENGAQALFLTPAATCGLFNQDHFGIDFPWRVACAILIFRDLSHITVIVLSIQEAHAAVAEVRAQVGRSSLHINFVIVSTDFIGCSCVSVSI